MTKDEALRMARRALYFAHDDGYSNELSQEAITAIKEALQSPQDVSEDTNNEQVEQESTNLERHERNVQQLFGTPQPKEPEQEPTPTPNEGFEGSIRIFLKKSDGQWERLEKLEQVHEYNKQQWAQPVQEPVAWRYRMPVQDGHWVWNYTTYIDDPKDQRCEPLYTTPPQRKPLLASDIVTMYDENPRSDSEMIDFARAIEAAHGIKENT